MPSHRLRRAAVATSAAALLATVAAPAQAVEPVVTLSGNAALTTVRGTDVSAARFHVHTHFSTDTGGASPFTIQKAVIFFPDRAGTNGRLFPSCSARRIERFHGNVRRCPPSSRIGSGIVKAKAVQLGITATGHVTLFNSRHGNAVTLNIQTYFPALINKSFEVPLTQLHGRYGEKLTLAVPSSLQQIFDGIWVAVQDFDVTVTGVARSHGVTYSYLKARRCPTAALHGVFDFIDGETGKTASTTADARVHCRLG
jgi:hypothetical protein